MLDSENELPLADAEQLDQLADDFETQFNAAESPSISEYLQSTRLPRKAVLRELIRLDHELRRKAGNPRQVHEYVREFPNDQATVLDALKETPKETHEPTGVTTEPAEVTENLVLPKRIGRYEIRQSLGVGGFGSVYLAHDTQLDRLVAIKLPKTSRSSTDSQIADFLREASVAANLKHPCLVSVFDVQLEDRRPYIVYEYVQGENLASWAARQKLPFQQIVNLLIQVADGLRHAHQHGVIHCDLKLANILIDQDTKPRIADFGLAIRDQFIAPDYEISGTPISMAPEQVRGERRLIDARTDIWALGVMFYELLLGRRPFCGQSHVELYDCIENSEPTPPSQFDPSLPSELSRICLKCLAKDRADRYQSVDALVKDLEDWLAQENLSSVPPPASRFLPSFFEWAEFPWFPTSMRWNSDERSIMRLASLRIGLIAAALLLLLGSAPLLVWNVRSQRSEFMRQLVSQLMKTELGNIPSLISEAHVSPQRLRSALPPMAVDNPSQSLRIDLAFLNHEPHRLADIQSQLLELSPEQITSLRPTLAPYARQLSDYLWNVVEQQAADVSARSSARRLLAATSFLSEYTAPDDARWTLVSPAIVDCLLNLAVESNREWASLHRQIFAYLSPALNRIRREETLERQPNEIQRPYTPEQIDLVVDVLVDFFDQDTTALGEILFTGLPNHFGRVYPKFALHKELALQLARTQLEQEATREWQDPAWSSSLTIPETYATKLQRASGLLTESFALCQTLPLDEFQDLAMRLQDFGYRPIRVRPYRDETQVLTAAIWARDGKSTQFEWSLTKSEMEECVAASLADGLMPADVAGYTVWQDGELEERFTLLLSEAEDDLSNIQIYAGIAEDEQWPTEFELANRQYRKALAFQCYQGKTGDRRYCGIIAKKQSDSSTTFKCQSHVDFESYEDWDRILTDISLCPVEEPQTADAYFGRVIREWDLKGPLQDWTNSSNRSLLLAEALFHTKDYEAALRECNNVIRQCPHVALPYRLRSRIRAMLATKELADDAANKVSAEIADDLNKFARLTFSPAEAISARAVTYAYLTEIEPQRTQAYLDELETLALREPHDPRLQVVVANTFAACSAILEPPAEDAQRPFSQKATEYLNAACEAGFQDWVGLIRNSDWAYLLEREQLRALQKNTRPQLVYAGVRCTSRDMDATEIHGLTMPEHLKRCQQLAAQGFRPTALSLVKAGGETIGASVWQRPMVSQDALEEIAIRHANAGVAAFQLGSPQELWPLLDRRPDPRVRTRVIHTIAPARCEPVLLVERIFVRLDDAQKFAILQMLGELELSQSQRDRASQEVVKWFEFEIDAGVHSACEWLLRKWGLTEEIDTVHARMATGRREGERRWYRDQLNLLTFACIDGPVEYMRGIPRNAHTFFVLHRETRIRARINRSFAIATTEVNVADFQRMKNDYHLSIPFDQPRMISPTSAAHGVNWKLAALYCQYLDKVQHTPENQWCFTEIAEDTKPVLLAGDYLSRTGYRLPTASEWEYAARAGVSTSRYFGENTAFADEYEWYSFNSNHKLNPVGGRKPNDFGLFDILGNVSEWLMERDYSAYSMGPSGDDIEDSLLYSNNLARRLQGANYATIPSGVRTTFGSTALPLDGNSTRGLRLARTLPLKDD